MELREALGQISEIREHIARTETFRGYRSLTVAFSGLLALSAAAVQGILVPKPSEKLDVYLTLWVGVAAVSLLVAGTEILFRARSSQSRLARETTTLAVLQFLPCVAVGTVVTAFVAADAREAAWMLPGLWSLFFSLGVFASFRLLPRQVFFVGLYYLGCGAACLLFGRTYGDLNPWLMGGSFGVGQLLAAGILFWKLERNDARSS